MSSVFLLAFPPGGYQAIAAFKYRLFLLVCGGYCIAVLVARAKRLAASGPQVGKIPEAVKGIPHTAKLLLLFLTFTVLSSMLSGYEGTLVGAFRREGALTVAIYVISCLFLSKHCSPKRWMLFLIGASVCLFCILCFVQIAGQNPFLLYPAGYNYYGANIYYSGEYLGTIGNTGQCAAFLSIAAGVLAMSIIKFDFKSKWLLSVPLFMAVFLMSEMNVEAGQAALGLGLLLMLPVAATDQKSLANTLFVIAITILAFSLQLFAAAIVAGALGVAVAKANALARIPTRWYRVSAVAVVLSALCIAFLFLWFYSGDKSGMLYEASEALHGRWDDSFGTWRIFIWRNVISELPGNLLLGTGPDTLGYWNLELYERTSEELGTIITARIDAAHNEYLQILACGGILSLVCYLGALLHAAARWFVSPGNKLSAVAGAGALFYCIQAFFGISSCVSAPFFWTALAFLMHADDHAEGKQAEKN